MTEKEFLRSRLRNRLDLFGDFDQDIGKVAERLRSIQTYREAKCVFASAAVLLRQIRINCLVDGKNLIMPASGLKDGFYIIQQHSVPFKKIQHAVTYKGLPTFGKRLTSKNISKLNLELMLTDVLAVDPEGGRLGSGNGFFDLSFSLLGELHALKKLPSIFAVANDKQLIDKKIPSDPWDVKMAGVITSNNVRYFNQGQQNQPKIYWKELPFKRIRKISLLWDLYQNTLTS